MSDPEATLDERKQVLVDIVAKLRADAGDVLKVAPDSVPPQVKSLIKVEPDSVLKSINDFLDKIDEEARAEFLEFLIMSTSQLQKQSVNMKDRLAIRIQPEGEPRTPPRVFKGFKKRRGEW